jgi:S1-C subfamily serine protease
MPTRSVRTIMLVLVLGAFAFAVRPSLDRLLFSATETRSVEARGNLADAERTNIEIFQHASPSVVQVVGRTGGSDQELLGTAGEGVKSGSGFVWDSAGYIVTNNHVVEAVGSLVVRSLRARWPKVKR